MIKPKIVLSEQQHRERTVVKILFDKNDEILALLRRLPELRWSQTMKSWYAPYRTTLVQEIFKSLRGAAYVDYSEAEGRGATKSLAKTANTGATADKDVTLRSSLDTLHEEKITAFTRWMRSRRYSESTIGTYTNTLSVFLGYYQGQSIESINNQDVIEFNNGYILKNKLSASYQNQLVNAVKLFFRTVEQRKLQIGEIHRPK